MEQELVTLVKGDIIRDHGAIIFIITQDNKKVSRKQLELWKENGDIYFDKHQWGADNYIARN